MGNKLTGSSSKASNGTSAGNDMKRALIAFKGLAGPTDYISRDQFLNDVFGGFLPASCGARLFDALGGTKKGIACKELVDGLSIFVVSDQKTRAKFVFRFYASDAGVDTLYKDEFLRKLREDQSVIPSSLSLLFQNNTSVIDFNSFWMWLQSNAEAIELYRFLNQGISLTAAPEKFIPSFHQVLAGITHFSEENVSTLERTFWQLISSSSSHQFDCAVFLRVVSPPLSPDVGKLLFESFDDRKDGNLDLRELAAGVSACCYGPVVEKTKFIFRLFDTDEDGLLNPVEIDMMLTALLKSHVLLHGNSASSNSGSVIFLLSDISNIRDNILSTFSSGLEQSSGLNLEQFLQWTLNCSLHQPFLDLLFQVCHIAFGIKPHDKLQEGAIVKSYLDRCDATELIPGDTVYIIPANWWLSWCTWVGLRTQPQLPRSQTAKLSTSNLVALNQQSSFQSSKQLYDAMKDASSNHKRNGSLALVHNEREVANGNDLIVRQFSLDAAESVSATYNHNNSGRPVLRIGRFSNVSIEDSPKEASEPSQIDTTPLLSSSPAPNDQNKLCLTLESSRPLRLSIAPYTPGTGFEVLPSPIWGAFQAWYGCKQNTWPISRRVIANPLTSVPEIEYQPVRFTFVRQSQPIVSNGNATSMSSLNAGNVAAIPFGIGSAAASLMRSFLGATSACAYPGVVPYTPSAPAIPTLSASVSSNDQTSNNINSGVSSTSSKYYDAAYGYYSRCATIGDIMKTFVGRFHLSVDSIRLWLLKSGSSVNAKRTLIWYPGQPDNVTLSQACSIQPIESVGDVTAVLEFRILIEVANADQTWPEDAYLEATSSANGRDSPKAADAQSLSSANSSTVGLIGFQNLGNTCFLNAALQCLSNTPPLTRYFLRNLHLSELNMKNPLGFHGLVALRYAELIRMVWTSSSGQSANSNQKPLSPAKIKNLIAKTWRQFGDSDQQDASELMTFLLDGLHEDLNRKRREPLSSSSLTSPGNHEINNSKLAVPDESASVVTTATKKPAPNETSSPKGVIAAWKNHLEMNDSVIVDLFHGLLSFEITCPSCNNASTTFDPFSYLVLPLPMDRKLTVELIVMFLDVTRPALRIGVRVRAGGICRDIYEQAEKVLLGVSKKHRKLGDNSNEESLEHRFILAEVSNASVVRFYDATDSLAQPTGIVSGELVLYEVISKTATKYRADDSNSGSSSHYHFGGNLGSCGDERCKRRFALYDQLFVPVHWRDRFFIIVNRQLVSIQNYILPQLNWRPVLFGRPYIVPIPYASKDASEFCERMYSEVWNKAQRFLSPTSKQNPKFAVVPNSSGGNYARDGDFPPDDNHPFPFELTLVAGPHCQRCSVCPWYSFCRGCIVDYKWKPSANKSSNVPDMLEMGGPFVAVNWDPRTLYLHYSHYAESYSQLHESVDICRRKAVEPLSLHDCLATFCQKEPVDGYICDRKDCPSKAPRDEQNTSTTMTTAALPVTASSNMNLARLPPVLIVTLKRFFMARDGRWMKSSRSINVPIEDLDLNEYMSSASDVSDTNAGCNRFRLYAAVCHYGAMRSGHYVTYAKHQPSGTWYLYDDSSLKESSPSEIDMSAVYLLFYERVGLEYDAVLPNIDELATPQDSVDALKAAENAEEQRLAEAKARGLAVDEFSSGSGRCSIQ